MNRNDRLAFRANSVERQALQNMALSEGRKPSEMLRELVREGAQRRGVWPAGVQSETANHKQPVRAG